MAVRVEFALHKHNHLGGRQQQLKLGWVVALALVIALVSYRPTFPGSTTGRSLQQLNAGQLKQAPAQVNSRSFSK